LHFLKIRIFLQKGLDNEKTTVEVICPSGKSAARQATNQDGLSLPTLTGSRSVSATQLKRGLRLDIAKAKSDIDNPPISRHAVSNAL
jgi:hypothetical protein